MTAEQQRELKARNLRLALILTALAVALFVGSFFFLPK